MTARPVAAIARSDMSKAGHVLSVLAILVTL
jgi:hypothetical protein